MLAALVLLVLLASLPRFFSIYRSAAFDTFPRDPYETYLLYLAGEPGGSLPNAPHVYRVLSVAAALPAYKLLPVYRFSRLAEPDPALLKATQAMAALSYAAVLGTCLVVFLTVRRGYGASPRAALTAALAAYIVMEGTNLFAMDTVAVLLVALLAALMNRPWLFAGTILIAAGFNEKIPLIFVMLFVARTVADRSPRWLPQLSAAAAATVLYFGARWWFAFPGSAHQTDPASFVPAIGHMLALTVSLKGLIQNAFPALFVFLLWWLARLGPFGRAGESRNALFHPADLAAFLGLLALAFATRIEYGVGRVILYCFPLYLSAATAALERKLPR